MSDELESILAESLHQRALQVGVHQHGFGEVRRRVRRHRQRQMAAGLLPAVAGFGWIVTRPVASDPLRPGGDAGGCGSTLPATTWLDGSPGSSTTPGMPGPIDSSLPPFISTTAPPPWTGEPTTLPLGASGPYVTDVNGNPVATSVYLDANGRVVRDANGNPVPVSNPEGTTTTYPRSTLPATTIEVDANGNPTATMIVPGTDAVATTIACADATTMPPSTGSSITDQGDSTSTSTSTVVDPGAVTTSPIESTTTSITSIG